MMKHFLIYNRYGPIVVTHKCSEWIVRLPRRPPEVFTGSFPTDCLENAREITSEEVSSVLDGTLQLS